MFDDEDAFQEDPFSHFKEKIIKAYKQCVEQTASDEFSIIDLLVWDNEKEEGAGYEVFDPWKTESLIERLKGENCREGLTRLLRCGIGKRNLNRCNFVLLRYGRSGNAKGVRSEIGRASCRERVF